MATDTKIVERIRALLAMAQDTSSPHEAAIAAGRAAALMRKYNLEHADVIRDELKHDENIIRQNARGNIWRAKARSIPKWSGVMAVNVARLFDCAAVQAGTPGNWYVQFWGYHTDVQVAVWTYTFLLEQVKRNHERYCNAHDATSTRSDRMAYIDGFAMALNLKLQQMKTEKDTAEQTESTSRASGLQARRHPSEVRNDRVQGVQAA